MIDETEVGQVRHALICSLSKWLTCYGRSQLLVKLSLSTARQQIVCIGSTTGQGGWKPDTGSTQVQKMTRNDGAGSRMLCIPVSFGLSSHGTCSENVYIRAMGSLKSFGNKRYINATHLRLIKDHNEVNFHFLEAFTVELIFQKGPVRRASRAYGIMLTRRVAFEA